MMNRNTDAAGALFVVRPYMVLTVDRSLFFSV